MSRTLVGLIALLSAALRGQDPISVLARDARAALLQPGGQAVLIAFTADPAPSGGDIFHTVVSAAGSEIVLVTPAGNEINAANAEAQGYAFTSFPAVANSAFLTGPAAIPGFHTFIELPPGATPGEYQIKALPGAIAAPATVRSFYNSSSPVRVALAAGDQFVRAGEPIAFSAMIFEGSAPLAGAKAMLRIRSQDNLAAPAEADFELPDSSDIDPTAGDGHYIGLWESVRPGRYTAALKATGVSSNGQAFSRIATADFTVLPALARLEAITDSAIDDNGDGMPDRVIISANLVVSTAGNYQLLFNLRSGEKFLTSRTSGKLETGPARIDAGIGFADLATLAADGPYAITDVFLLYLDDGEVPTADERADAGLTAAYAVSGFAGAKPLTASAGSLAFGDVETGTEKSLDLVLTNSAAYPFTEAILRINNELFTVQSPITVPARGTLTLPVRFRPVAVGAQSGTLTIAGLTVTLAANGVAAAPNPVPVLISLAPSSANAGGAAFTLTVNGSNFVRASVVRWNGTARATTFLSATSLAAAIAAADIATAGTAQVTVFSPAPGGGTSAIGNFPIPSANAPAAVIEVTPPALAFGDAAVGQSKDLPIVIRNSGAAGLTISSITSSVSAFTLPVLATPATVAPGASVSVNVRFIPAAAGAQNAVLTIASNAAARPSVPIAVTGTGTSTPAVRTVTLGVDDGSYETSVGQPAGIPYVAFVNRLTPSSYPAKLTKIQVYFGNASDELPLGHPVTLMVAANPGGTASINGLTFQRIDTTIGALGGFNSLTLATPVTITAGDFVVGFSTRNPPNIYPMSADTTPPLRQRSYIGTDGINFNLADNLDKDLASNFAIRAVVDLP